jgi:hypothetical protein
MKQDIVNVGLCTYCAAAPACSFLKASGPPIVQCEEFENVFQPGAAASGSSRLADIGVEDLPHRDIKDPVWERTGLCGNCANSGSCALPKDEGGVWRCEEYR